MSHIYFYTRIPDEDAKELFYLKEISTSENRIETELQQNIESVLL